MWQANFSCFQPAAMVDCLRIFLQSLKIVGLTVYWSRFIEYDKVHSRNLSIKYNEDLRSLVVHSAATYKNISIYYFWCSWLYEYWKEQSKKACPKQSCNKSAHTFLTSCRSLWKGTLIVWVPRAREAQAVTLHEQIRSYILMWLFHYVQPSLKANSSIKQLQRITWT